MGARWGVDIGGSGIKAAPVDLGSGTLVAARQRRGTPLPATPHGIATEVAHLLRETPAGEPVGIALPAVVKAGVVHTCANIDPTWVGFEARAMFEQRLERPVALVNDADAAGLAELAFGAARGRSGTTVVVTLGTGIGTAVLVEGRLFPNTELGHLEVGGHNMCFHASVAEKKRLGLTWAQWTPRVQAYLSRLEELLWPDLIVIGGGVSRHAEKFLPRLRTRAELVPAANLNEAGIIGAALAGDADVDAAQAG